MLVKILGGIDLAAALAFLMLVFGIEVFYLYIVFCAVLLFFKGLFAFGGDVLSFVDLISAVVLILSLFVGLPAIVIWVPAFLLLAKGLVSFL